MKLEIRFANGYWGHFDTNSYRTIKLFDTRKEAEQALKSKAR